MNIKLTLIFASLFGGLSVMLGAFGAHALKSVLSESSMNTFDTAVTYQMWHSAVLLFVALIMMHSPLAQFRWAALSFVVGIVFFSGSLYLLAFGGPRWLGPVTPLGGMSFIVGWLLLLLGVFKGEFDITS